jgi:hypothetical protein
LVLQAFCELVSLVQTASSFHHCNPWVPCSYHYEE